MNKKHSIFFVFIMISAFALGLSFNLNEQVKLSGFVIFIQGKANEDSVKII